MGTFDKRKYKGMTVNGYTWFAHDNGIHSFSRNENGQYGVIQCEQEQITNGDIEFMTESGLTISEHRKKRAQLKYLINKNAEN